MFGNNQRVEEIAQNLTQAIIDQLSEDPGNWTKPWVARQGADIPHNPISNTVYKGGNVLHLMFVAIANNYSTGRWATFKQWQSVGCKIVKGSSATHAVKWNFKWKCDTCKGKLQDKRCAKHPDASRQVAWANTFPLFNADQVEGEIPVHASFPLASDEDDTPEAIEVRAMFATVGVDWQEKACDRAAYSPTHDSVVTPLADQFTSVGAYAATVAHEFGHWTGHSSRLNREAGMQSRFGTKAYAFEELIAELTSVFVCNLIGVEHEPVPNHAAYIDNWLSALKSDDGPALLWKACTNSTAAAQFITERIQGEEIELAQAA